MPTAQDAATDDGSVTQVDDRISPLPLLLIVSSTRDACCTGSTRDHLPCTYPRGTTSLKMVEQAFVPAEGRRRLDIQERTPPFPIAADPAAREGRQTLVTGCPGSYGVTPRQAPSNSASRTVGLMVALILWDGELPRLPAPQRHVPVGSTFDMLHDHSLPLALDGTNTVDNLQCGPCNREKGAHP